MTRKERFEGVIRYFEQERPVAETELEYTDPFELLVAVILSAQCTDKRVNMTTPALFAAFPDAASMAVATPDQIFPYIRSISYPNNKAKHLAGMARMLVERFKGKVPSSVEELVQLPGVGRKTANVIASVVYNLPAIAVDTHVFRVSNRLRLAQGLTPLEVEKKLMKAIPQDKWSAAHHWLIWHGRLICKARKPLCHSCKLAELCPSSGK